MTPPSTVGVLGLGLIGGSIAKGLLEQGVSVHGLDVRADVMASAGDDGVIVHDNLSSLLSSTKLLLLATPISQYNALLPQIVDFASDDPAVEPLVVSDVGSSKVPFFNAAEKSHPARRVRFVGGHPMAGTERSGYKNSSPTLFEGSVWVVTIDSRTQLADALQVFTVALTLGSKVVPLTSQEHDAVVARISHTPYVLAGLLATSLGGSTALNQALNLAAGSFRDATRVAGSDPDFSADLCYWNRSNLLDSLSSLRNELERVYDILENASRPRDLVDFFTSAKSVRDEFLASRRLERIVDLDLADEHEAKRRLVEIGRVGGRLVDISTTADDKLKAAVQYPA